MQETLILNHDFRPLQTISWKKAICLVIKDKAEVLKYSTRTVRTPNTEYKIPIIIRLIKIVRQIYKNTVPITKKNVIIRDNYTCQYCRKKEPGNRITVDHIIPSSRGGKNSWENMVACCMECNIYKNDKLPKEKNMKLIKQPKQPTISEFLMIKLKIDGYDKTINEFLQNIMN